MSEYETLFKKLENSKNIEIEDIDRNNIEDITHININKDLSAYERIIEYIKKTENPYILKINDTLVKITYSDSNIEFKQCLNNIVRNNA